MALALAAVSVLLFADLFLGRALYLRDITRYSYPTKMVVAKTIRAGDLPLWDRYHGAGQPMAANPRYEVFYPGQWPILLPDFDFGFDLHVVLHLPVGIVGMFLLLRSLALRRSAAMFGAVTFAFCGPMASLLNLLPSLFAHTWTPWILLFVIRTLRRPSFRDTALAGLAIGMQTLVLMPSLSIGTMILVGSTTLYFLTRRAVPRKRVIAAGASVVLAGVIGAMIAGAVILPAVDHAADSARGGALTKEMLQYWQFPLERLGELIVPHLLGYRPFDGGVYWGRAVIPEGAPFIQNVYSGILVPILVVSGLLAFWRERCIRWMTVTLTILLLMAVGSDGPLMSALQNVAPFSQLRYTEKYILPASFVGIVAASVAFDRLGRHRRLTRLSFVVGLAVVALVVVCGVAWLSGAAPRSLGDRLSLDTASAEIVRSAGTRALAGAFFRAVVALLLLYAWLTRNRRAIGLTLAFTAIDLAVLTTSLNPRLPDRFFGDEPEVVSELGPARDTWRMLHLAEWHRGSPTARMYFDDEKNVYWMIRNGLFPRVSAAWGFQNVFDTDIDRTFLKPAHELIDAMWKARDRNPKAIDLFSAMSNVSYLAAYRPPNESALLSQGDPTRVRPIVFVPMGDHPRYYFADEISTISSIDDFIDQVSSGQHSPRVAFVAEDDVPDAPGSVVSVDEGANHARLEVDTEGRALLVASVTFHKYWRALVDGQSTPLIRVNVGYQGVVVPAGRHEVEFRYHNPIVVRGVGVSIAGLVLAGTLLCLSPRSRRSG